MRSRGPAVHHRATSRLVYYLWGSGLHEAGPTGLALNLLLTAVALGAGMITGIPLGVLRGVAPIWVHAPISLLLSLVRATPLLLLVLWVFLLIQAVLALALQPIWIGCIALSLHAATHVSDIVRSGTMAATPALRKTSRALGLTHLQTARYVVIPIAIRVMLPAFTSFATSLFKDTSVCYVIGIVELMQLGMLETTRDPSHLLRSYGMVAGLFFAISLLGTRIARRFEVKARLRGTLA